MASPTNPTISGQREGFNCRMTVAKYGSMVCRVTAIAPNIEIIAETQSAGSQDAFYPYQYDASSFAMQVLHASWAEREAFNKWLRRYMVKVTNNEPIGGTILIEVPGRRFTRVAVPQSGVEYGDDINAVTFTTNLQFVGASDPLSAIGSNGVSGDSYVKQARNGLATSKYFYPTGTQVSGAASLEGTIFDKTPTPEAINPNGVSGVLLPGTGSQFIRQPGDAFKTGG